MSLPARHPLAHGIALALAFGAGGAQAAEFSVTTSADSGPGSLRQAVLEANAIRGADQISIATGLGAILLSSGQIDITETLMITGPASGQTIDAGGNSRIFGVTAADQPLTLENLTLTGGRTEADGVYPALCADSTGEGGGICALGDVTLVSSTVSGNSTAGDKAYGGGLFVDGDVTLSNSSVSGNTTAGVDADGGGFCVLGDATLNTSTVSGNRTTGYAGHGGGIDLYFGTLNLSNSTVSGNSTVGGEAYGGGVRIWGGSATVSNSTVSGNHSASSGGGLFFYDGQATLTNSTVTANRSATGAGGIEIGAGYYAYSLTLTSTILAANSGPAGNVDTRNFVGGNATLNASSSLFGDAQIEINGIDSDNVSTDNPQLAPLTNYGCATPSGAPGNAVCVHTHAPLPNSPAVDAGSNPFNLNTDQRGTGFPRVVGAAADIGAFELGACATLHVTGRVTSKSELHNACQIRAGPSLVVESGGDLILKSIARVVLDGDVWIESGGRLRVQIVR